MGMHQMHALLICARELFVSEFIVCVVVCSLFFWKSAFSQRTFLSCVNNLLTLLETFSFLLVSKHLLFVVYLFGMFRVLNIFHVFVRKLFHLSFVFRFSFLYIHLVRRKVFQFVRSFIGTRIS